MRRITLHHQVRTLDDQLLFPAGTLLTKEKMDAAIRLHGADSYQTHPLLSYGTVKGDLSYLLGVSPYVTIFMDRREMNDLMSLLESLHFPIPILQSLDYFKKHDFHTYAHVLLVFVLSVLLAKDLIPDEKERIPLTAAGPTHDMGKTCVPLQILRKTTPLTKEERSLIEHHAAASYALLSYYYKNTQHLACRVALDHHERRDGSGYPRGILLKDPLVEIVAVSDVYDALIKPRSYRSEAYDNRTALEEITEMAEQNKVGWDVVKALIARNRRPHPHYKEITISAQRRGSPPSLNFYGITVDDRDEDGP